MKKIALLLVLLTSTFLVRAQTGKCKSGDCVNGKGEFYYLLQDSKYEHKEESYIGGFKDGLYEGFGIYKLISHYPKAKQKGMDDIESYEGYWKNGKKEGSGKYFNNNLNKEEEYTGEWKNGLKDGEGICIYKKGAKWNGSLTDGDKYEGNWLNGVKDGYGKYYYSSGYYEGNWANGMQNGDGAVYDKNGTVTKGKWENNKLIETYETYNSNAEKFTGKLKDGKKSGKGQFYLHDGTIIEGNFIDDKLDGKGKITYLDGSIYEGEIKDYKASGYGKTTLWGNYHKGNYLNGLKHGTGAYVQTNGQTFEGEWSNGIQMSGKYYQQGELIFEGNREDYIADIEKNHADFKKHLAERRTIINAENEAKKKAEEIRQSNMTEEEKLIEKYPCAFCSAKGTIPCPGGGKSTDVKVNNKTYGNLTITEVVETTTTTPSLQCPCNWCNGKKYLKP